FPRLARIVAYLGKGHPEVKRVRRPVPRGEIASSIWQIDEVVACDVEVPAAAWQGSDVRRKELAQVIFRRAGQAIARIFTHFAFDGARPATYDVSREFHVERGIDRGDVLLDSGPLPDFLVPEEPIQRNAEKNGDDRDNDQQFDQREAAITHQR